VRAQGLRRRLTQALVLVFALGWLAVFLLRDRGQAMVPSWR